MAECLPTKTMTLAWPPELPKKKDEEEEAGGHTETILFGVLGLLFSDMLLHLISIRITTLPTTVAHTSNASTQKIEIEGTKVQGQSELLREAYLIKKKKKHCSIILLCDDIKMCCR